MRSSSGLARAVWVCAVLACLATTLKAEAPLSAEIETTPAARPISPPKSRGSISPRNAPPESAWWTTLGGLATVLTILGGTAWVVRKNLPGVPKGLPKSVVEVLGRKTLEPRAAIHLVRCGSRILVLGTTPQGMVSLAEITDAAEVDFVSGLCRTEDEASQHSFLDLIGKFRRGDDPRLDEVEPGEPATNPRDEEPPARTSPARTHDFDPAARLKNRMASDRRRVTAPVTELTPGEETSNA
jgi:flagellar protein FliO/FliZ